MTEPTATGRTVAQDEDGGLRGAAPRVPLPPRIPWWRAWSWLLLAAALACGYLLAVAYGQGSFGRRLIDALKLFPGFPGYEGGRPWQYVLARHLAAVVALLVTARVVIALLGERVAEVRARFRRGHAVICGLGDTGLRSARAFGEAGYRVTCLDRAGEHAKTDARALGALVLRRDATQASALEDARAARAEFVVCACPDDATNAKIASLVVALAHARGGGSPSVHVAIDDPDLARLLRAPLASVGAARLHFFNLANVWARAMLDAAERASPEPPRIVVLGSTSLARAIVVESARRWHRRARAEGNDERATIVLAAPDAVETSAAVVDRYPALARVCDLVPVTQSLTASAPLAFAAGDSEPDTLFACLDDDSVNLALALEAERLVPPAARVFLPAAATAEALAPLLTGGDRINAVGLPENAAAIDLLHDSMGDALAREVHERHLADRRREPDFGSRPADRRWEELDAETRRSNHQHVDAMIEQLRAVWYEVEPLYDWDEPQVELSEEAVGAMAELEHARWSRARRAAGWVHAEVRDDTRKRHDLLVPWSELPDAACERSRTMVRGRPSLLALAGYRLQLDPARERLARRLHERYAETRTERGEEAPLAVPWDELDEEQRDLNRSSVDHIAVKLARIGRRIAPRAVAADAVDFTPVEVEEMARIEHDRWLAERVARGWTVGPRNDAARTHPAIVPWSELSEDEREKDREVVRAIPALLVEAGYVVVRA